MDTTQAKFVRLYRGEDKDLDALKTCSRTTDFREVLGRKDVDAVMISTPDHWHVPIAVAAAKAGKDICCEKPLSRSIADGRVLADTVRKHGCIFRTDSEFRSIPVFHQGGPVDPQRADRPAEVRRNGGPVPSRGNASAARDAGARRTGLRYVAWAGAGEAVHRNACASAQGLRPTRLVRLSRLLRRRHGELGTSHGRRRSVGDRQ